MHLMRLGRSGCPSILFRGPAPAGIACLEEEKSLLWFWDLYFPVNTAPCILARTTYWLPWKIAFSPDLCVTGKWTMLAHL